MKSTQNARDRGGVAWGFQKRAVWAVGESTPKSVAALPPAIALSAQAMAMQKPGELPVHPVGLWRLSAYVTSGQAVVGQLTYGSGDETLVLDNLILPLVAYVPGYASLIVRPLAEVEVATQVCGSAVPVFAYGLQQVGQLVDATVAPVVLPGCAFGFTAYEASSYTPTGAPAPIAITAGSTVDTAGLVVLNTGSGVAWCEL